MKIRAVTVFAMFSAMAALPHAASGAERVLDGALLQQLATLSPSQHLPVDAFPVGPTRSARIRFQRVPLYAPSAHVYAETSAGRIELPRSKLIFVRGYSDNGDARVALTLTPQFTVLRGGGDGPEGSFALHAIPKQGSVELAAVKLGSALPAGFDFKFRCGNESERVVSITQTGQPGLATQLAKATQAAAASQSLRFAVVAVDTDSAFMSVFSNNTTNATDYIATMFNTMNLMYERDLQVQLQIGTTILRTSVATDPYATFTAGATTAQLDTFGAYWKNNESGVTRSFAILLSGVYPSSQNGCGASGLAWIDQYCKKGTTAGADTVGSYSINQICTNLAIDQSDQLNARVVGHELGHNFGAWHTHCTDSSDGSAPVGTNTIDTCLSGESYVINGVTKSCYSGPTSCPAAGAGTIMSYCNVSGCPANTQDLLQFHPTQIAAANVGLLDLIDAAPANCLNTTDDIFFDLFE